jgi:hypothetical protein
MKTIIAGGRDYEFTKFDIDLLDRLTITEVVSGCARGADTEGETYAEISNIPVKQFPADWGKYGRGAGPVRNKQMADYAQAAVLFPGGTGTNNMYRQAKDKGLVVYDYR